MRLAERVIDHRTLFFSAEDSPFMFSFDVRTPEGVKSARYRSWDSPVDGKTLRERLQEGTVRVSGPIYYLAPTRWPGPYANTFGLGSGLLAVPVLAVIRPFVGPLAKHPAVIWYVGKLVAAVSGSAVFLFLAALASCRALTSFALALAYGLGTCAWSISS